MKRTLNLIVFVTLTILLTASLISCQSKDSNEQMVSTFIVKANNGRILSISKNGKSVNKAIMISQGDIAVMKFSTDQPFRVSVHGYDIEHDVNPEIEASLEFRILGEFTGSFPIHMHDIENDSKSSGDDKNGKHKHETTNGTHTLITNFVVNPN